MGRPRIRALTPATLDRAAGYQLLGELQDEQTRQGWSGHVGAGGARLRRLGGPPRLFGGIYQRGGLDLREPTAREPRHARHPRRGWTRSSPAHVKTSVRIGMNRTEILEVFRPPGALHRHAEGAGRAPGGHPLRSPRSTASEHDPDGAHGAG